MALRHPVPPTLSGTKIRLAGQSESGKVRSINQDSFFVGEMGRRGVLAVVADGMGGHQTGEVASQRAVAIVKKELEKSRAQPPAAIARAVQAANTNIFEYAAENPGNYGMGTTLTTVFIDDQVGLVAHIGDTRAYLVRGGHIRQLTQDHSWVADRVRQGVLTEEEAKKHRWRNVITNALGAMHEIKLDVLHFEVQAGDRLLLCSDGVTMLLPDETLAQIVSRHAPEEAVTEILARANRQGSPDNITAVVLQVETLEPNPKRYALPKDFQDSPGSVSIGTTMSGIRKIEEAFRVQDLLSKLRRHPWYPFRFWLLGCLYLVLLILFFSLR